MHRRSVALSTIALACASVAPSTASSVRPDDRAGRHEGARVGLAATGSGTMTPAQLVARSTHLARRRQTRGRRRAA